MGFIDRAPDVIKHGSRKQVNRLSIRAYEGAVPGCVQLVQVYSPDGRCLENFEADYERGFTGEHAWYQAIDWAIKQKEFLHYDARNFGPPARNGFRTREPLRNWQKDPDIYRDENGNVKEDWVTCGHCGRKWNDALGTTMTPAPAARCPFEDEHEYEEED